MLQLLQATDVLGDLFDHVTETLAQLLNEVVRFAGGTPQHVLSEANDVLNFLEVRQALQGGVLQHVDAAKRLRRRRQRLCPLVRRHELRRLCAAAEEVAVEAVRAAKRCQLSDEERRHPVEQRATVEGAGTAGRRHDTVQHGNHHTFILLHSVEQEAFRLLQVWIRECCFFSKNADDAANESRRWHGNAQKFLRRCVEERRETRGYVEHIAEVLHALRDRAHVPLGDSDAEVDKGRRQAEGGGQIFDRFFLPLRDVQKHARRDRRQGVRAGLTVVVIGRWVEEIVTHIGADNAGRRFLE